MYMVLFVVDDPNLLYKVLEAWDAQGITGATIIESTGLNRLKKARKVGTPFMSTLNRFVTSIEEGHATLMTIVPDTDMVEKCLRGAEQVVGDLDEPDNGIFAAWPLAYVKGVRSSSDPK